MYSVFEHQLEILNQQFSQNQIIKLKNGMNIKGFDRKLELCKTEIIDEIIYRNKEKEDSLKLTWHYQIQIMIQTVKYKFKMDMI